MMKEDKVARLRFKIYIGDYTVPLPKVMSDWANCPSCSESVCKDWIYCPRCACKLPTELEVNTSITKYNDDLRTMQSKFFNDCWELLYLNETFLSQKKITNLILAWQFSEDLLTTEEDMNRFLTLLIDFSEAISK